MKLLLYKLINKLGYRIEKKRFDKKKLAPYLLKYNSSNFEDLYVSREYIKALADKYEDFHLQDQGKGYLVKFNNFKFFIEGNEEFYVLNEIFVENDYHFETSKKTILIDIGANVGIASVYFSKIKNVEKIYAFEPVQPTYKLNMQNLELNGLQHKVTLENFGLGDKNKTTTFKFDPNSKGSAGLSSINSDRYKDNANAIEIDVDIRNSYEVLEKIISKYPEYQIIVKMDCEGAENEILQSLEQNQLLNNIHSLMIEWHHDNYDFVTNLLLENNFSFFTKCAIPQAGLILAFKNNHA